MDNALTPLMRKAGMSVKKFQRYWHDRRPGQPPSILTREIVIVA
jgi:hypothetical protein